MRVATALVVISLVRVASAEVPTPKILDERLAFDLFAAEPQIVTPTGIAVDDQGRVLCIESHTHFRPAGYKGPETDRIRRFEDTNGDGRADKITTFFEGTKYTMNLAVHYDGSVIVATRNEIFRLRDKDNDGAAEERTTLVRLETKGDYPHNGLSGFAFDFAGNIFFGFGENLGESYQLVGSDGGTLSGGGEGGNIYRCGPNGEKLHQVATGFWNPFHLANDSFGRLFAVDNDPDARPPCRLLHIVQDGDYGFRFRLGRRGTHPFQSWNGEVPGTLPMVSGTGEAPSGVIAYESDGLPKEYFGDLLVTSWGDHRIERHTLTQRGASYGSKMQTIVQGGVDFRPVGIALAPDGSLFISDWVKRDYNLHGHGRIWRLSMKNAPRAERPTDLVAAINSRHRPLREAAARRFGALARTSADPKVTSPLFAEFFKITKDPGHDTVARASLYSAARLNQLCAAYVEKDQGLYTIPLGAHGASQTPPEILLRYKIPTRTGRPAVAAAAFHRLADALVKEGFVPKLESPLVDPKLFDDADPFLAHAARRAWAATWTVNDTEQATKLASGLQRLAALLVMRGTNKPELRRTLTAWLRDADVNVRFAATQWVAEGRLTEYRAELENALKGPATRDLFFAYLAALEALDGNNRPDNWEQHSEKHIVRIIERDDAPPDLRRLALRMLRPNHPALNKARLDKLIASADAATMLEIVRTLREVSAGERLVKIAADEQISAPIRAEAVAGLNDESDPRGELRLKLAACDEPDIAAEAQRALVGAALSEENLSKLATAADDKERIERLKSSEWKPDRPANSDTNSWLQFVDSSGNANVAAGERIFFSGIANCSRCHQYQGRGGRIGPDLTTVGGQLTRERLLDSILNPSKEIAPHYVAHAVRRRDGSSFTGVFVTEDGARNQHFADAEGKTHSVGAEDIEERRAIETSIMPDDVAKRLTLQELRDLVGFLGAKH